MQHNVPKNIPDTYVKPYVRFQLSDHETKVLAQSSALMTVVSQDMTDFDSPEDAINTLMQAKDKAGSETERGDHKESKTFLVQAHVLLAMRIFLGALAAGNTLHDSHLACCSVLSKNPYQGIAEAMRWAEPDLDLMSSGDDAYFSPSDPELSKQAATIMSRAEHVFLHCARTIPAVEAWSKLGIKLGLDAQEIADAASSLLTFDPIFGDYECDCSFCTDNLN
jgi:hypothetical protein